MLLAAEGTGVLDDGVARSLLLHIQLLLSPKAPKFEPQALSNSLWSLAKLGHAGGQELLPAAAVAVMQHGCMLGATPQNWSNLVWAYAKLGQQQPDSHEGCQGLCRYVAEQVVQHGCMCGAAPQNWSNLVWAFAKLRHYEEGRAVLDHAIATCPALLQDISALGITQLLYACATMHYTCGMGQLLDDMLPHIRDRLGQHSGQDMADSFNGHALANSCWSLVMLGLSSHPAMEDLMREANRHQHQPGYFTQEGLSQLWQAQLELQKQGLHGLTGQLHEEARRAWKDRGAEADGRPEEGLQPHPASQSVASGGVAASVPEGSYVQQGQRDAATAGSGPPPAGLPPAPAAELLGMRPPPSSLGGTTTGDWWAWL